MQLAAQEFQTFPENTAVQWLIKSEDPSVRYLAMRDLLDLPPDSPELTGAGKQIPHGHWVSALLQGQESDGGFGVHPYQKWTGAHWRLVSLVELGVPAGFRPAVRATDLVLKWLLSEDHTSNIPKINGLYRRCASQEGNALAVCSRLGLGDDHRVAKLASSLIEWQWPDGGWNCDRKEEARHSSFNESLAPLWGLVEYYKATGNKDAQMASTRTAEFFLKHRLFRSCRSNDVRPPETFHGVVFTEGPWKEASVFVHLLTQLHYPLYWHCDILQELTMLSRLSKLDDERTSEALEIVEKKRGSDGMWRPEAYYWNASRPSETKTQVKTSNVEVVDWGRRGPNKMITLNALRVLKHAGRIKPDPSQN